MQHSESSQRNSTSALVAGRLRSSTNSAVAQQLETPLAQITSSSSQEAVNKLNNEQQEGQREIPHTQGSNLRKRSRPEGNQYVKEGLSKREEDNKKSVIDNLLQSLQQQVDQVISKADKSKTITNRLTIMEIFRNLGLEICYLLAANRVLHEEKDAAQQQVISLQSQIFNIQSNEPQSYLSALMKPAIVPNIVGQKVAPPEISRNLKHAPPERILIFKADVKGVQVTKEKHNQFRQEVFEVVGESIMNSIEVIRPTRHGGHTIIFNNSGARDEALANFRENERKAHIDIERSCIIAPNKKYAKVVCRDPPDDIPVEVLKKDMYENNNPHLRRVPIELREARILKTRYGWIFELSSLEAAAIQAQGGRIRFGHAREIKTEEYIPIQQCYFCCGFGHSAKFCNMHTPRCRLCGVIGHTGWECPVKENKAAWRCANCIYSNELNGTNFSISHGSAQLHKCPCALNHKSLRKSQLIAAGIYTTPETDDWDTIDNVRNTVMSGETVQQQIKAVGKKGKSRSRSIRRKYMTMPYQHHSSQTLASSSALISHQTASSSSSSSIRPSPVNATQAAVQSSNDVLLYRQRMMKVSRPKSYDGWKAVGRQSRPVVAAIEEHRGRDCTYVNDGTNSTTNITMVDSHSPDAHLTPTT